MSNIDRPFSKTAHLKYPTHATYVFQSKISGRIHCIKYSNSGIDWQTFYNDDWEGCQEYMITNLPGQRWGYVDDTQ